MRLLGQQVLLYHLISCMHNLRLILEGPTIVFKSGLFPSLVSRLEFNLELYIVLWCASADTILLSKEAWSVWTWLEKQVRVGVGRLSSKSTCSDWFGLKIDFKAISNLIDALTECRSSLAILIQFVFIRYKVGQM